MSRSLFESTRASSSSGFTSNNRGVLGYSKCMDEIENPEILTVLKDDHYVSKSHRDYQPYEPRKATDFPTHWNHSNSGYTNMYQHTSSALIACDVHRSIANDWALDKCGDLQGNLLTESGAAYNKDIDRSFPNMPIGRVRSFNTGFTLSANPLGARFLNTACTGTPTNEIKSTYATDFLPNKLLTGIEFNPDIVANNESGYSNQRNIIAPYLDLKAAKAPTDPCNFEAKTSYESHLREILIIKEHLGAHLTPKNGKSFKFGNDDQLTHFLKGTVEFQTTYANAFYDQSLSGMGIEGYHGVQPTSESAYSKNTQPYSVKHEKCPSIDFGGVDDLSATSNKKSILGN